MKRSSLSYNNWACIEAKKYHGEYIVTEYFNGFIGLLEIEKVSKPQIWEFDSKEIVVCDKGIKWLSILPSNDFYCITAMMDSNNRILLWYIDMIASQGFDDNGVPYFEDLYLDLVVYPDGTVKVDDMDELEKALSVNDITQEQFDSAIFTCNKLKTGFLVDLESLIEFTLMCYKTIIQK